MSVKAKAKASGKVMKAKSGVSKERAPVYEVYAMKYAGPLPRKGAFMRWLQGFDQDVEANYYIWAIRAPDGETCIVDAGTNPAFAAQWADRYRITNFVDPRIMIARLGVRPEQVTRVIVTHIHFDHVGGAVTWPGTYPNAKFYIQKKEYDFWIEDPMAKRVPFVFLTDPDANAALASFKGTRKLFTARGDTEIAPGITLLLAPGHSPGLQTVMVNTAKGPIILASDCAHATQSFKDDIPSSLIFDLPTWIRSYDKLRSKVKLEHLFSGHDLDMMRDYPKVAEDITRLA